jgi:hypothetical protein
LFVAHGGNPFEGRFLDQICRLPGQLAQAHSRAASYAVHDGRIRLAGSSGPAYASVKADGYAVQTASRIPEGRPVRIHDLANYSASEIIVASLPTRERIDLPVHKKERRMFRTFRLPESVASAAIICLVMWSIVAVFPAASAEAGRKDSSVRLAAKKGLDYLKREQRRQGYWEANGGQYKVAMTALAANALACEGSTTKRGKYAENIRRAVDYLVQNANPKTGLIGFEKDYHYMYGHGFSMLFLSQIYGEEEDVERRMELRRVLTKAVEFCGNAQTAAGGWGYVSAKDGNGFDEGSTCITQVQGLRACRNAGIPTSREIIDRAVKYIEKCTTPEGGVQYSIRGGGARPAITAAAVACLFNSGQNESKYVKKLLLYCEKHVWPGKSGHTYFGHWHYTHYYYAQVMYRLGDKKWKKYFNLISRDIIRKQSQSGGWKEGHIGPVYTTAINTTILQLDNGYLPIYQR